MSAAREFNGKWRTATAIPASDKQFLRRGVETDTDSVEPPILRSFAFPLEWRTATEFQDENMDDIAACHRQMSFYS